MSAAENNNHQGSWGSILLIYGIGVLGATTISQAITVARDMAVFFHAAPQQAGWIISTPSALVVIGAVLTGWVRSLASRDRPLRDLDEALAGALSQADGGLRPHVGAGTGEPGDG